MSKFLRFQMIVDSGSGGRHNINSDHSAYRKDPRDRVVIRGTDFAGWREMTVR
jgi:hypothetical protein